MIIYPKRKLHQSPGEASVDSDLAKFGKPLQKGSRRRGRPAAGWRAGQGRSGFASPVSSPSSLGGSPRNVRASASDSNQYQPSTGYS